MEIDRCGSREMQRLDARAGEELIRALCEGRLVLAFQPIVQLNHLDTPCLYNEVLLRQVYGSMASINVQSCSDAIGALELGGQITRLDFSVLWTVIGLLESYPDQRLGCNLSAASLRDRTGWGSLLSYLTVNGEVARRLTLEITETSAIPNGDAEMTIVAAVRACGARIAIDDLGGGFTTFEFLARCRPDVVKVDRSILLRACSSGAPANLLSNLVRVCTDYSPCIVVEGVETEQELEVVSRSGAHAFQGFLTAPPTLEPVWLESPPLVVNAFDALAPDQRHGGSMWS